MLKWFPIPVCSVVGLRGSPKKHFVATLDDAPYDIPEVETYGPAISINLAGDVIGWFDVEGDYYRPVLDRLRPAGENEFQKPEPYRLHFSWRWPNEDRWIDHPCARDVTFEPDDLSQSPITVDLTLANYVDHSQFSASKAMVDAAQATCKVVNGILMKRASPPIYQMDIATREITVAIPDAMPCLPLRFFFPPRHLSLYPRKRRSAYELIDYSEADLEAIRQTYRSVAVAVWDHLAKIKLGKIDEGDLELLKDVRETMRSGLREVSDFDLRYLIRQMSQSRNRMLREMSGALNDCLQRLPEVDIPDEDVAYFSKSTGSTQ